jgi:hypothetical protein
MDLPSSGGRMGNKKQSGCHIFDFQKTFSLTMMPLNSLMRSFLLSAGLISQQM